VHRQVILRLFAGVVAAVQAGTGAGLVEAVDGLRLPQLLPGQTGRQRPFENIFPALLLHLDFLPTSGESVPVGRGQIDSLSSPDHVDESEFRHRAEDEAGARQEPDLAGFDVRHFREVLVDAAVQSDEGEHRGGAEGDSRGRGVSLQPEGHPRGAHQEDGGEEVVHDVVAHLAGQSELQDELAEVAN
jgi:hypothetical protein